MLLTTPNGYSFRNRLPTYQEVDDPSTLEARQFQPDADGHLFLLTIEELSNIASAAGLRIERINCWGTPLVSGHVGLRLFAGPLLARIAYHAELFVQHLSSPRKVRMCSALSAVLSQA